jgi:hypothetical protein
MNLLGRISKMTGNVAAFEWVVVPNLIVTLMQAIQRYFDVATVA